MRETSSGNGFIVMTTLEDVVPPTTPCARSAPWSTPRSKR